MKVENIFLQIFYQFPDFAIYDNIGVSCIAYCKRTRCILAGSKSGHVVAYDERAFHKPLSCVHAHDYAIKCLAFDPRENFYVTGSASGDVKAWDVSTHQLMYECPQEHPRNSIFRHYGSGTMKVQVTGDFIFSCGADGTLKMTDCRSVGLI